MKRRRIAKRIATFSLAVATLFTASAAYAEKVYGDDTIDYAGEIGTEYTGTLAEYEAAVAATTELTGSGLYQWNLELVSEAYTEEDPSCGYDEEHQHEDDCYQTVLECGLENHTHTDECYNTYLSCTMDEHVHTADCEETYSELTCKKHEHSDSCYEDYQELTCREREHTHSDRCYESGWVCICDNGWHYLFGHNSSCYQWQTRLTCNKTEHTHGDNCYTTRTRTICGYNSNHTHTDRCYRTRTRLVCGYPSNYNHTHGDDCYTTELICTTPEHSHDASCAAQELTCGYPDHEHTDACYTVTENHFFNDRDEMDPHDCYIMVCDRGNYDHRRVNGPDRCINRRRQLACNNPNHVTRTLNCNAHVHTADCYADVTECVCGLEEHTHDESCYTYHEAVYKYWLSAVETTIYVYAQLPATCYTNGKLDSAKVEALGIDPSSIKLNGNSAKWFTIGTITVAGVLPAATTLNQSYTDEQKAAVVAALDQISYLYSNTNHSFMDGYDLGNVANVVLKSENGVNDYSIAKTESPNTANSWHLDLIFKDVYTVSYSDGLTTLQSTPAVAGSTTPAYTGAEIVVPEANAQYTYSVGTPAWTGFSETVTGDVTYVPNIVSTTNEYTVTWTNEDGSILTTSSNVPFGTSINTGVEAAEAGLNYPGEIPTKESDDQYNYIFAGWTIVSGNATVAGNTTAQAQFVADERVYSISFQNYDGTDLGYGTEASYSEITPDLYDGPAPTREGDAQYSYEFNGTWEVSVNTEEGTVVYTANFDQITNTYTVTYLDEDGTLLEEITGEYGSFPTYTKALPTKASTAQYAYTFAAWDETPVVITGDASYVATYTATIRNYTVSFVDYDGTIISEVVVPYDGTATAPANPSRVGYNFNGWSGSYANVKGDVTVTATYAIVDAPVENMPVIVPNQPAQPANNQNAQPANNQPVNNQNEDEQGIAEEDDVEITDGDVALGDSDDADDEENGELADLGDGTTPLGAAEDTCFIHWIMLLLTIAIALYTFARVFAVANAKEDAKEAESKEN